MKKVLSYLVVIFVTAILSFVLVDMFRGDSPPEKNVVQETLYSTILKENRDIIIRLPRLYDSTKRYPVLYVVDGSSLDLPITESLGVLSTAGYSPEAIVVGIPNMTGENRELNLTPPFMRRDNDNEKSEPGEADNFLNFLEDELIPYVEEKYPATSRVFCGNSRGGLVVLYSMIRKPALFDGRICFSTPFWRQDDILIDSVTSFLNRTDSLNTFIYLSAGSDETENIRGGLGRITSVLKTAPQIVLHSELTPKAIHQNNAIFSSASAIAAWGKYHLVKTGNSKK